MMSLLTLFGGLKNVFKVDFCSMRYVLALDIDTLGENIHNRYLLIQTTLQGRYGIASI